MKNSLEQNNYAQLHNYTNENLELIQRNNFTFARFSKFT